MTDHQTNSITPASSSEHVPWYLKKADRPKTQISIKLFTADISFMDANTTIDNRSVFVRYLFDCFHAAIVPTLLGFKEYLSNGEKPLNDKQVG